jgi:hypothetical protein
LIFAADDPDCQKQGRRPAGNRNSVTDRKAKELTDLVLERLNFRALGNPP